MFLFSCDLESEHNLGSGYYLIGTKSNTSVVKKVEGKKGIFDGVILGEIVEYKFNDGYILILRNASDKAKSYNENDPLGELQKGDSTIQYWIIQKVNNKVFGPMSISEYKSRKKQLNIEGIELEKIPLEWKFR